MHRDVKPSDSLLDGSAGDAPWAVLTDFATATLLDEVHPLARNDRVAGSLPCPAPELLTAEHVWPTTDVYAPAATLVEMRTGVPP